MIFIIIIIAYMLIYLFLCQTLRKSLDSAGLNKVQIVAPDGSFSGIADAVLKDPDLADAVSILG